MIPQELVDAFNQFGLPVVVALLTTLVVEYFAKPRLEARKARLLRDRQQIDEVIFGFQKVAMLAAALLPNEMSQRRPEIVAIQRRQIERLGPSIEALFDAVARLPSAFVSKHNWQVSAAGYFVSYFAGVVWRELESESPDADRLKTIGKDVSEFDAYFAAHASFRDSQEKWIKRAFSRRFMRADYRAQAESALSRNGLIAPLG